jgi:hypothetical protein
LISDAAVCNYQIANFIAAIRRIDNAAIPNDGGIHR